MPTDTAVDTASWDTGGGPPIEESLCDPWTGLVEPYEYEVDVALAVVSADTVSVGAGSFIAYRVDATEVGDLTQSEWYAEGVGLVLLIAYADNGLPESWITLDAIADP